MVVAMAGFAVEDAVIKQLSYTMPISQVLLLIGIGGLLIFGMAALQTDVPLVTDEMVKGWFIIRTMSELASAICFVIAIVYASLSISSAILQATHRPAVSLAAILSVTRCFLNSALVLGNGC